MNTKELTEGRKTDDLKGSLTHRAEFLRMKRENARLTEEAINAEKRLEIVLELDKHRSYTYKVKPTKGIASEAVPIMLLSDVHFEEKVSFASTNGLNRYSTAIAKDSIGAFFTHSARLIEILGRDIEIRKAVIGILGDMISGFIHEELMLSNTLTPPETLLELDDVLTSGLKWFLDKTKLDSVSVVCKHGNHARTTKKLYIANGAKNSYEWLLYHHLAKNFSGDERVTFIIEDSYLTYLTVFDRYDLRFHHGNAIGFQGGVGGITIPVNKAIAQWDRERRASMDFLAHFHTLLLDAGKFVANGSLIGYSPYGLFTKFPYEPARQAFVLLDKKRGFTFRAPIFVR